MTASGRPTDAAHPYDGIALRLGGGRVLLGPVGSLLVVRALDLAARTAGRDGIGVSADLAALLAAIGPEAAEAMSARGRADVREVPALPPSTTDEIDTEEAARMLGITARGVRHAAARGELGRKVRGRWVLDRAEVAAYDRREQRAS